MYNIRADEGVLKAHMGQAMRSSERICRRLRGLGGVTGLAVAGALVGVACGGGTKGVSADAGGARGSLGGAGATSHVRGAGGAGARGNGCTDATALRFAFPSMYSAYDGVHEFKVPNAILFDTGAAVRWSVSDERLASLAPDALSGGIVATTREAGKVTIQAELPGGACGSVELTIREATPAEWETGRTRYESGDPLPTIADPPVAPADGSNLLEAGGVHPACLGCHDPDHPVPVFRASSPSPMQMGGSSDDALMAVFRDGVIPAEDYYLSYVPQETWRVFHRWTVTDEEALGLVVYQRSLPPKVMSPVADFRGLPPHAGGDAGAR